jgi:hypothetical protein
MSKLIILTGRCHDDLLSRLEKLSHRVCYEYPEWHGVPLHAERIIQDVDGVIVPRVRNSSEHDTVVVVTQSSIVFDTLRVAIKENRLHACDVSIEWIVDSEKLNLSIDQDGRLPYWPAGFFDTTELLLAKLIQS